MRYLLILPLLLVFVTGICATEAKAWPLGISKYEDCEENVDGIDCEEKTVITVPVSYGLPQTLEVVLPTNGLEETVAITITKTVPVETYPLRYLHTVPYFPYEQVIQVPHPLSGGEGCIDCWDAEGPTCGWTLDDGTRIEDSQGFCIEKTAEELERTCLRFRGEELFSENATTENPYSTAHCLRPGELYFAGYEISEYIRCYEIEVKVTKGDETHTFYLSPSDPLYSCEDDIDYSGNLTMKAVLIGDTAEYTGAVELDNYILYIPASPDSHPFVQDYQNNMLLVPREELSRDGGEPDKVGVSFYTFRLLGSDYRVSQAGDGLHNQLFHKHNSDLQKLIADPDAETTYLVHGKKDFKVMTPVDGFWPKELQHRVFDINNSLVAITMKDVETVKSIKTESIGAIVEAYVDTFASMSENGNMKVVIGNYGDLKTNYIVTVTNCNQNILCGMPAQARTLDPYDEEEVKFDVSTVYNLETTNECLVTLKSDTGRVYDKTTVIFDTEKQPGEHHPTRYSWDLQEKNEASENTSAMMETGTGTGTAWFRWDAGWFSQITTIAEGDLPAAGKPELTFQHGFFSFEIMGLTPGQTVVVTITLPSAVPAGTQYWKYHVPEGWVNVSSLLGDNDGDNILTLTLTDGGLGDDDGAANGVIVDAGGPGVPPAAPAEGAGPGYHSLNTDIVGTKVSFLRTYSGKIMKTGKVTSPDGMVAITIPKDTMAKDKNGNGLGTLRVSVNDNPPPPPEDNQIIGLTYSFKPDGATFDPPITLTWHYNPETLPSGVIEKDLVLACYDKETKKWVTVDSIVDKEKHTITAPVSHLTDFAIIGKITPIPASFSASKLLVQPAEVKPDEVVTVTVTVTNTGVTEGTYNLTLKINGVNEETKDITVAAGASESVSFTLSKKQSGIYGVDVNGLEGSFTVIAPPPATILPPSPTLPKPAPVPPPTPPPTSVLPPAPEPVSINWWLVVGIVIIMVVVVPLIYRLFRRRRKA